MCNQHKKALQEPSPTEPRFGQCLGNLPCEHIIPLYPLRFGVSDQPLSGALLSDFNNLGYPALKAGKTYGLRVLRQNTYVYLLYRKDGQMWVQHYQVTEDARFARIWWTEADHAAVTPGRHARPEYARGLPYLSAPSTAASETIHVLVSDNLLTHCALWRIQHDIDGLRTMLGTEIKPAAGVNQKFVFDANLLGQHVNELRRDGRNFQAYGWSESRNSRPFIDLFNAMRIALLPAKDRVPLAVVMQDLAGVLSEQNVILGGRIDTLSGYSMEAGRKLRVSEWIDRLGQQAANDTRNSLVSNGVLGGDLMRGVSGPAAKAERDRIVAAEKRARDKRLAYCRNAERLSWVEKHPARRDALVGAVVTAAEDLWNVYWAQQIQFNALVATHDPEDDESYLDLRCLAGNTLTGLIQCRAGQDYLQAQLTDHGPVGLLGAVLKGNRRVASYIKSSVSGVRQMMTNPPLKAFQDLLKALPADAASQQLSATVGALVSAGKLGSAGAYSTSIYRPIMEVLDGELLRSEKVPLTELGNRVREQLGLKGISGFRPQSVANAARVLVEIYSSADVQADLAKVKGLPDRLRFWHNVRIGLSGVATLASAFTATNAFKALGKEDGLTFSNALNAGGRLAGVAGGVAGTTRFHYEKLRDQAGVRGDSLAYEYYRKTSETWERRALATATVAALLLAGKDSLSAYGSRGDASAINLSSAGVQSVAATVNGLQLWNKIARNRVAEAAESRIALARGAVAVARLSSGTAGWILLAVEAAYLMLRNWHDKVVAEQKVTIWIARSVWGNGRNDAYFSSEGLFAFADDEEEQHAFQRLFQMPHIETDVAVLKLLARTVPVGMTVLSDEVRTVKVALPGWQPQVSALRLTQKHAAMLSHPMGREQTISEPASVVVRNGVGYIELNTNTVVGKTTVEYWPNAFTDPQYVLKESNWL